MKRPSNGDLPAEIVQEILLRLPVKTLSRFKCVCKQWCALIGSPTFVNQHYGRESNQERLLVRHYKPNEERHAFALFVDDICSGYEEPDHLQMPETVVDLLGPLNGVFCVVSKSGRMALLNPAMRQFKPLPLHYQDVQPHLSPYHKFFGFGLDPLSGDHKIVAIQFFSNKQTNVQIYPPLVSVYNSGGDSWRHLEDVDFFKSMHCARRSLCNTYLNGVYYWLMEYRHSDIAILAFDMSSEKFREIEISDSVVSKLWDADLTLYGDSIALLSYDILGWVDKSVGVWVMENEGCWTKSLTLGPFQDMRWPLGFWKNNELLLETVTTTLLNLYDVSTRKLRTVGIRRKEIGFSKHWVFAYKESLVSVKREGDDSKVWDISSDFVKDFFK